jgi:hypothetical protein
MRAVLVGLSCAAAAVGMAELVAGAGCSEAPQVAFGNPSALDRKNIPGEGGTEILSCTGIDAGTFMGDGGCPSFATNIYPLVAANGAWRCADAICHGTQTPIFQCQNPQSCLTELRGISVGGRPYIARDGGTLSCNLQGSCGSKMPRPPGTDPSPRELCMVEAWLNCGSPP